MTEKKGSFFGTLPGILTAIAAILTALATLIISLDKVGYLDDADASNDKKAAEESRHFTPQEKATENKADQQVIQQTTSLAKPIATQPSSNPNESINGQWIFTNKYRFSVDVTGKKKKRYLDPVEDTIQLTEKDNIISGIYKWTTKGCSQATISGRRNGSEIELVSTFTGTCCNGAKTIFTGKQVSANTLIGKTKPVDLPPENCIIYWADVTASKS